MRAAATWVWALLIVASVLVWIAVIRLAVDMLDALKVLR